MGSRLGRVGPDKDAARIVDVVDHCVRVLDLKDEVLRSPLVAEVDGLLPRLDLDDDGFGDGLAGDVAAGKGVRLVLDGLLDCGKLGRRQVDANEDDLGVDAVLGLREEVGRNEVGVGLGVCDDLG